MICTTGPWRRQATTKCSRPPGWRTTTIAGSTAARTRARDRREAGPARRRDRRRSRDLRGCRSTCRRRRSDTPRAGGRSWRAARIRRAGTSGRRARSPSRRSARPPAQEPRGSGPSPPRQLPAGGRRGSTGRVEGAAEHSEHEPRGTHALDFDLDGAGQRVADRQRRRQRVTSSSTRTRPSRISLATRETLARRLPYLRPGKAEQPNATGLAARTRPIAAAGANCATTRSGPSGTIAARRSPSSTTAPIWRSTASAMRPSTGARSTRRSTSYSRRFTAPRTWPPRPRAATACRAAAESARGDRSRASSAPGRFAPARGGRVGAGAPPGDLGSRARVFRLGDDALGPQAREPSRVLFGEAARRLGLAQERALLLLADAVARCSSAIARSSAAISLWMPAISGPSAVTRARASSSASRSASASSSTSTSPARTRAPRARLTRTTRPRHPRVDGVRCGRRFDACARARFVQRDSGEQEPCGPRPQQAGRGDGRPDGAAPLRLDRSQRAGERTRHAAPL